MIITHVDSHEPVQMIKHIVEISDVHLEVEEPVKITIIEIVQDYTQSDYWFEDLQLVHDIMPSDMNEDELLEDCLDIIQVIQ